ncbi:MAG: hypothetical protein QM817_32490 [Archangium sp.]
MGLLGKVVKWVLGEDLAEQREAEKKKEAAKPFERPTHRRNEGDGFDAQPRAQKEALGSTVDVPVQGVVADQPEPGAAASGFTASFDDLKDLVDEPIEPRGEFIPEGGMSTESLMREFDSLDADLQVAAVEAAARAAEEESRVAAAAVAVAVAPIDASTQALMREFEPVQAPAPGEVAEVVAPAEVTASAAAASVVPTPAWLMRPTVDAAPRAAVVATTQFDASVDDLAAQMEAAEAKRSVVAPGEMATESLMSEFDALTPEAQAEAVELEAQRRALVAEAEARKQAEAESSFEAAVDAVAVVPPTPAWLMPATSAAPRVVAPIPAAQMSTESLMSEFESLTPEAQAEAVELETKRRALAAEAEAKKRADAESVVLQPASAPPTPAWLMPATSAAPRAAPQVPAASMSTESLMGEFESLAPEAQAEAIELEAKRRALAAEAEEKKRAETAASVVPQPGSAPPTPAWLMPATSAAPRPAVPVPAASMSTESLMGEFDSLAPEAQAEAIELEAKRRALAAEAEEAKRRAAAAEVASAPLPGPLRASQGEGDDD